MAEDSYIPVDTGLPADDGVDESSEADSNVKSVSITALMGEKAADGSAEKTATPEKGKPDASGATQKPKQNERTFTQAELNQILADRLEQERKKPAYQYGAAAISARAKRDGVTEQEAFTRIRAEENARIAKEYADNPEKAYADMLNGTFNPYAPQQQEQPKTPQQPQYRYAAEEVAETLETMEKGGKLPQGFTSESVTNEFAMDAMKNGVEAALYRWITANPNRNVTRESVADEMARRRNLPTPMQSGGGNVTNRSVSPKAMSKEEFAKLDKEIEKGHRSGFAVRIED